MLKFKEYSYFDKLYIDSNYVFDIIFWVETEYIEDARGQKFYLRNIVATQRKENGEINIALRISESEDDCKAWDEYDFNVFKNGGKIKKQLLDYINDNIEKIIYDDKHRR